MLKKIQSKLVSCGYITNNSEDKKSRIKITEIISDLLFNEDKSIVLKAVDHFVDYWKQAQNKLAQNNIRNKAAYFKFAIEREINELMTPDIEFAVQQITEEDITKTILDYIHFASTKHNNEFETFNPATLISDENPFEDISDELFEKAFNEIKGSKDFYSPLIERLLALNEIDNDGPSIKNELDEIYEKLTAGPTVDDYLKELKLTKGKIENDYHR